MTSIFQRKKFPSDKMAKMKVLTVSFGVQTVDIDYKDLDLKIINNQLCFFYSSPEGDLIMPIARVSTIENLIEKNK